MKKISNLLILALLTIGMGLTSCDEQLDNAVTPVVAEVTSITVDLPKIDEKYLDTEKTKLQLTVGDEVTLSFTILPEEMASTEVELTAADATILSIDGLKVKALKEGETKVTAKAGDKTAECTVTVKAAEVAVTGVKLDKAVLRIDKYNTIETLTATVSPAEATDKTVTWKSSDENVATVDASGKITPIKAGTVTIQATAGDKTATSTVYVYDEINTFFSGLDQSINVPTGKSYMFTSYGGTPSNTKIIIEDGATVTLNGINFTNQIECKGTATIILADGSTNTVTASGGKAGIKIGGNGTTLTINAETLGTGILNATGGSQAAGIGTNKNDTGGNIVINGGRVTATGGDYAAGIGTGYASGSANECGTITINGGTVTATGGMGAAGIGTGLANGSSSPNECGDITIGTGVTSVTATMGAASSYSIGKGLGANQTCGTITIGGTVYAGGVTISPFTYTPSN